MKTKEIGNRLHSLFFYVVALAIAILDFSARLDFKIIASFLRAHMVAWN